MIANSARRWVAEGFTEALRTPDSTLIFVTPEKALEIRNDQINCMGCLSACQFSNWAQNEQGSDRQEGRPAQLLHPEDIAGDPAFRRRRIPADVRRTQRLPLCERPVLCERLCSHRQGAGRARADRRLTTVFAARAALFPETAAYITSMELPPTCPDVVERLRAAGLRPTRQRLALARLLFDGGDRHVTAEHLHGEAQARAIRVSLATVYNTLHQFTAAGLLREVVVEPGRSYFDTNVSDHHHFFCEFDGSSAGHPRRVGHGRAVASAARGGRDPSRRCDHPHPPRSCDTFSLRLESF